MSLVGVYPGSFNPPTVAHLAIAEGFRARHRLDVVEFVLSRDPLGKALPPGPSPDQRLDVLHRIGDRLGWAVARLTDAQLLADIADGYDAIVMGADKWHQIHDVTFYGGSAAARDAAIARLPAATIVPRGELEVPPHLQLDIDPGHQEVSSTLARSGRLDIMAPEAIESGLWTP